MLILQATLQEHEITGQFVNIQTSSEYAKLTKIDALVDPFTIKGTLLYCGPFDFVELANKKDSELYDFIQTVGWSYFGKKSLKNYRTRSMLQSYSL